MDEKFAIKHKIRFSIFAALYILGYLYFCICGGLAHVNKVSNSMAFRYIVYRYNLPVGSLNMSQNMFIWVLLSFFIVLFILWQTNLINQKLNRSFLFCEGMNILFTCLSFGVIELITGKDGVFMIICILMALLLIIGIPVLLIFYIPFKKGRLEYSSVCDIMTESEYNKWMEKRKRGKQHGQAKK